MAEIFPSSELLPLGKALNIIILNRGEFHTAKDPTVALASRSLKEYLVRNKEEGAYELLSLLLEKFIDEKRKFEKSNNSSKGLKKRFHEGVSNTYQIIKQLNEFSPELFEVAFERIFTLESKEGDELKRKKLQLQSALQYLQLSILSDLRVLSIINDKNSDTSQSKPSKSQKVVEVTAEKKLTQNSKPTAALLSQLLPSMAIMMINQSIQDRQRLIPTILTIEIMNTIILISHYFSNIDLISKSHMNSGLLAPIYPTIIQTLEYYHTSYLDTSSAILTAVSEMSDTFHLTINVIRTQLSHHSSPNSNEPSSKFHLHEFQRSLSAIRASSSSSEGQISDIDSDSQLLEIIMESVCNRWKEWSSLLLIDSKLLHPNHLRFIKLSIHQYLSTLSIYYKEVIMSSSGSNHGGAQINEDYLLHLLVCLSFLIGKITKKNFVKYIDHSHFPILLQITSHLVCPFFQ